MKKLSDILEKLQSKYPDDQDVQMALELAPEDEMEMEDEGMDLGMEAEMEGEDLGMEAEEEGVDELGLPLPGEEEGDELDIDIEMEEEPKKKKKKPSDDMMGL